MTTTIHEVADNIFRISTPLPPDVVPGGFSFNQYLILDEAPLIFHTGPRRIFPLVREAIATVMPIERLRYVAFSHIEADEMGALNEFLAAAPEATAVCSNVAALVSGDMADRPPLGLADQQLLSLGKHAVRWLDTPHMPHGWECGYMFEESTKTLLCGDLFTQPGSGVAPLTEGDILGPSEAFRTQGMDYYSYTEKARPLLEKLAATKPETLACMHGSAWRGDGAALLMELADAFTS